MDIMRAITLTDGKTQYRHGGSPSLDLARFHLTDRDVLDFSVNLNFFGVPEIVRRQWMELLETIEGYPSVEGDGVAYYYQEKMGIPSQNFLAGNGSTELIYLVPRVFGFKRVVVVTPSYHDYERASVLSGAKVLRFPLSCENGFSFQDADKLIDSLNNADALWLGRPNNPTGNLFPGELLTDLADRFPEKWIIIDEAFIQFLDKWKENSFMLNRRRPNIIVIHSLTKFYALAGLRLGGIVGSEEAISRLREAKEPWTVNGVADRIARLLLECTGYEDKTRSIVIKERERVFKILDELEGIRPFPSSANFILCRWTGSENLDDLIRHLLDNGAYVRDCRNFPGLTKNFCRIGLRSPDDNDKLMSLLSSLPDW